MDKKKMFFAIGGLALLLLLLKKGKRRGCAVASVLNWSELAKKIGSKYGIPSRYILAVIHDQSFGNPNQIYYIGGIWKRYGLMGVPLAWAQEFGFRGTPKDLLNPEINIQYGVNILRYMDILIGEAYRAAGVETQFKSGISANAYSWYVTGQGLNISGANDPMIHKKDIIDRYLNLTRCY